MGKARGRDKKRGGEKSDGEGKWVRRGSEVTGQVHSWFAWIIGYP